MGATAEDIKARLLEAKRADIKARFFKQKPEGNALQAVVEPIAQIASGIVAVPAAGAVGAVTNLLTGDPKAAEAVMGDVQKALTFEPRSKAGERGTEIFANQPPLKFLGDVGQAIEKGPADAAFEATGSPLVGAAASAAPAAIAELLGVGLLRRLTRGLPENKLTISKDGVPSPELQEALSNAGLTIDDLSPAAVESLKGRTVDPEQATRAARLEQFDAPATQGDITGEFAQQATEARLVNAPDAVGADELRNLRLQQSQAFEASLNKQIEAAGIPDEVGDSIKAAISGRKKLEKAEKSRLYKEAFEASDSVGDVPVITDSILEAMPSEREIRRLSRISGNQAGAIEDLLVEFGIITDPAKVKAFTDPGMHGPGGTVEPLSVGNFEEFRQAINQIERADTTGSTKVITGPIKNAIDEGSDLIGDALESAGIVDEGILSGFRKARAKNVEVAKEFSPESISGRLINLRKDGNTPIVESSKVFNELMGTGKSPELLERVIDTLKKGGKAGKQAIGNLQAATILDLMNNALKASTRKIDGQRTIGGTAFNKRLEQIGERRMNKLFENDKTALKRIELLSETLEDLVPPSGAVPKGSGDVLLDLADKIGLTRVASRVPGFDIPLEGIRRLARMKGDRAQIEKAMDASPQLRATAAMISKGYPELAFVLGIGQLDNPRVIEQGALRAIGN